MHYTFEPSARVHSEPPPAAWNAAEPPYRREDETEEEMKEALLENANGFRDIMDDVYASTAYEERFHEALYRLFARWNAGGFISHDDADNQRVTIDWEVLIKLNGFMQHIEQALNRVAAERTARRT